MDMTISHPQDICQVRQGVGRDRRMYSSYRETAATIKAEGDTLLKNHCLMVPGG